MMCTAKDAFKKAIFLAQFIYQSVDYCGGDEPLNELIIKSARSSSWKDASMSFASMDLKTLV